MLSRILVTLAIVYVVKKMIAFRQAVRSVGNLGGYRVLLEGTEIYGRLIGRFPGITYGANFPFEDKHTAHAQVGCDITANVIAFPTSVHLSLADAQAIKEVTTYRARFPKPVAERYNSLSFFGLNIVASEGELWKKYRKITAPTFSDRNNRLVWDETVNIMNDLFDNMWSNKEVVTVDHCRDITLPIALLVIGVAGFGRRMTWTGDTVTPEGHKMSFHQALHIVSMQLLPRIALPDWVMGLTERLREIALGFTELRMYMTEMIDERLKSEKVERHDLFSSLLDANSEDDNDALTADELIGNIFIFLLAGHETTAHTLCFTFALLALYPNEQEKLYQHIKTVLPNPRAPTYEEMPLLTQSMAVFYETLRLVPPVPLIPKRSAEDTTLTTTNAEGENVVIPVPEGTYLDINVPALHYNPKYWENPHSFNPDRFLKPDWNKDAFLPFSAGARACLGRKFFETEGIAALTMLVSRYKITVKDEPEFAHETFDERRERLLRNNSVLTTTPIRVPLVFTRRS